MLNIAGKHTKEILEGFSYEDSSSSLNESSSPTQNKEFYSNEDETVGEFNKFEIKICAEKFTGDLKKDDQKVLNVEGKHRKEILEEFSYEDSYSSLNESSSPTQNKEFYSTEDEFNKFNKFEIKICAEKVTGDLKKDTQKMLNVEGKHSKEILEEFSHEDSSSSLNESSSPTQNKEFYSTEDGYKGFSSLIYEASPLVEECLLTEAETISSSKKFTGVLKKDTQNMFYVEGKH
ncbi:hypothetical protein AVEN_1714-1 [Araneus ventricosus]|uniref:Uncharacterized protein n=1 Tax=Araneus ventricosus TaxID=182803 RepID=A0A4Y2WI12_ARAVE|nr:hypothetical protein AVEN_1714-1 [Araneus ventricosus]